MQQVSTEWIEWQGGDCPLDKNVMVRVQARFEPEPIDDQMPRRASAWHWLHNPKDPLYDIIRYRPVSA